MVKWNQLANNFNAKCALHAEVNLFFETVTESLKRSSFQNAVIFSWLYRYLFVRNLLALLHQNIVFLDIILNYLPENIPWKNLDEAGELWNITLSTILSWLYSITCHRKYSPSENKKSLCIVDGIKPNLLIVRCDLIPDELWWANFLWFEWRQRGPVVRALDL